MISWKGEGGYRGSSSTTFLGGGEKITPTREKKDLFCCIGGKEKNLEKGERDVDDRY